MPLELPNLDDRTYNDLVQEALARISTLAPEWTNFNSSDPGITLVELFAFLTEMLIFRLNRVTDDHVLAFLKLLNGPDWTPQQDLVSETRSTVLALRKANRAITCIDFENLSLETDVTVARARCVASRNLEAENSLKRAEPRPGHMSVVIVPKASADTSRPLPDAGLLLAVHDYLEPRRLLTTQVHVVAPRYYTVEVKATLSIKPDAIPADVSSRAANSMKTFLHPLLGGDDGKGWPFGRNIFISELFSLLDKLPGIDYVSKVEFVVDDAARLLKNEHGDIYAVEIKPDELVDAAISNQDILLPAQNGG
jgi:hypothetical protein